MTANWLSNISAALAAGSAVAPFVGWSLKNANFVDNSLTNVLLGSAFWLFLAWVIHDVACRIVDE